MLFLKIFSDFNRFLFFGKIFSLRFFLLKMSCFGGSKKRDFYGFQDIFNGFFDAF